MVNETGFQLKVITVIVCLMIAVTQTYSSKHVLGYLRKDVCCKNGLKALLYEYLLLQKPCSWHVIGRIAVKFSSRLVMCLCNSAGNVEV